MIINTYELRKKYDEFKDLTEDQLMKIAELCMDYYKKGKFDAIDDAYEDKQDEIDDLQDKISELDEQVEEYNRLADKYEDFLPELYEQQPEDIKTEIINFADINRLTYKFYWLKNANNPE